MWHSRTPALLHSTTPGTPLASAIRDRRGVTLVEILVAAVLALVAIGAIYRLMMSQSRQHLLEYETLDAQETLRGAVALLSSELRQAAAGRNDLYAIAPDGFTVRSIEASGVVCGKSGLSYGVVQASGSFQATADDSALAYSTSAGAWKLLKVNQVWIDPSTTSVPVCAWAGGTTPSLVMSVLPGDTAGIGVGSPIRIFRRTQYGTFQQNGRWWMGRRVGSSTSYAVVTGPVRSPADSGLAMRYLDAAGNPTAVPSQVSQVVLTLRSESAGKARAGGDFAERHDSLSVHVLLRN